MLKLAAAFAACALAFSGHAARAQVQAPVVELYTSQGCSSCPAADAFLAELAQRDDVIALSLHVDYWDYIGWKDTFARPSHGERQKGYADALKGRRVYTPQMVIDGAAHEVGSNRAAVLAALERSRGARRLPVEMRREDGHVVVRIPAGAAQGDATIWLVRYDDGAEVAIPRGENGGRTIVYRNVVREISTLGVWRGEPVVATFSEAQLARGGRGGCAVIVQRDMYGPVLGAARLALAPAN